MTTGRGLEPRPKVPAYGRGPKNYQYYITHIMVPSRHIATMSYIQLKINLNMTCVILWAHILSNWNRCPQIVTTQGLQGNSLGSCVVLLDCILVL